MAVENFNTGDTFEGKSFIGSASTGFGGKKSRPGVTKITKGKGQGRKTIYKQETNQATKQQQPAEYNITNQATGEQVKVTKQNQSSYAETRLAQQYKADITTEQAKKIIASQGGIPPNKIKVAVDYQSVEDFNKGMSEAGFNNSGDLIRSINKGETKVNPDKTFTITKTEAKQTATQLEAPAATQEKNYLGWEDYFIKIGQQGQAELKAGLNQRFKTIPGKEGLTSFNSQFDTRIATGTAKTIYGAIGAGASSLIEPAINALKNPEKKVITETTSLQEIKSSQEKQARELATGQLQLGFLYGTFNPQPNEATRTAWLFTTEASATEARAPYIFKKPETPGAAETLFNFETKGLTQEQIIKNGFKPEEPGISKEANGLIPSKVEPSRVYKSFPSGEKFLVETEKPQLSGIQSQIYPKPLIESNSVSAPDISKLPIEKEIKIFFDREKNLYIQTNPSVKTDEVLKIFREENPGYRQTDLTLDYPQAQTLETYYQEPGNKIIFGKKANAQLTNFNTEINSPLEGTNIDRFKPDLSGVEPTSGIKPVTEIRIPVAIFTEGGNKFISPVISTESNIYETRINNNSSIKSINFGKIRDNTKIEQATNTSTGTRSRTNTQQKQISKQLTTPEIQPPNNQITTNKFYKELRIRTREDNIKTPKTPFPELPKPKIQRKESNLITGFNVFVKSKGIFNKVNTKPLIKNSAISLGANVVQSTPAVSFKIIPSKNLIINTGKSKKPNLKDFYINKKGIFIEKTSARINTPGEIRGIPGLGRTTKRLKKIFGA